MSCKVNALPADDLASCSCLIYNKFITLAIFKVVRMQFITNLEFSEFNLQFENFTKYLTLCCMSHNCGARRRQEIGTADNALKPPNLTNYFLC